MCLAHNLKKIEQQSQFQKQTLFTKRRIQLPNRTLSNLVVSTNLENPLAVLSNIRSSSQIVSRQFNESIWMCDANKMAIQIVHVFVEEDDKTAAS